MKLFTKFTKDESGAVTVDWVVLAGVVIAFALLVGSVITPKLNTALDTVGTKLTDAASNGG